MNPIDDLFRRLREQKRKAFMPFVTAGDPDLAFTREVLPDIPFGSGKGPLGDADELAGELRAFRMVARSLPVRVRPARDCIDRATISCV